MLFDAIDRATRIAQEIGGIDLVVNSKLSAIVFYRQYGFEQMQDHPRNLFLPIRKIRSRRQIANKLSNRLDYGLPFD